MITSIKKPAKFQPLDLLITIENEEELVVLTDLFGANGSTAAGIYRGYEDTAVRQKLLAKLMGELYTTLVDN